MTPVQPSVVAVQRHVMLSAVPSSGIVSSMIRITGIGDRDRPEWLIRISRLRSRRAHVDRSSSAKLGWAASRAKSSMAGRLRCTVHSWLDVLLRRIFLGSRMSRCSLARSGRWRAGSRVLWCTAGPGRRAAEPRRDDDARGLASHERQALAGARSAEAVVARTDRAIARAFEAMRPAGQRVTQAALALPAGAYPCAPLPAAGRGCGGRQRRLRPPPYLRAKRLRHQLLRRPAPRPRPAGASTRQPKI